MWLNMFSVILTCVVSLLSIVVSHYLGGTQKKHFEKRTALRDRYFDFYVPYISLTYIFRPWDINFSELSGDARDQFLNFLFSKMHYIDSDLINYVVLFYEGNALFSNLETGDSLSNFFCEKSEDQLNSAFNKLTMDILLRSIELSRQLYLPPFAECALTMYGIQVPAHKKGRLKNILWRVRL